MSFYLKMIIKCLSECVFVIVSMRHEAIENRYKSPVLWNFNIAEK